MISGKVLFSGWPPRWLPRAYDGCTSITIQPRKVALVSDPGFDAQGTSLN